MLNVNDLLKTKGKQVWCLEYDASLGDAIKLPRIDRKRAGRGA